MRCISKSQVMAGAARTMTGITLGGEMRFLFDHDKKPEPQLVDYSTAVIRAAGHAS